MVQLITSNFHVVLEGSIHIKDSYTSVGLVSFGCRLFVLVKCLSDNYYDIHILKGVRSTCSESGFLNYSTKKSFPLNSIEYFVPVFDFFYWYTPYLTVI